MGVEVRPVRPDEAAALKALRLRALAEAPLAFGSTLARETAFTDDIWAERATSTHERCVFVALDEGRWVGIATALAHAPDQPGPALVGMFVDPAQRGRGVVDALLDAAAGWVREHGGRQLYLWATSTNTPAVRAYARCGFHPTGDSRPLAHTPSLSEIRMLRDLTNPGTR